MPGLGRPTSRRCTGSTSRARRCTGSTRPPATTGPGRCRSSAGRSRCASRAARCSRSSTASTRSTSTTGETTFLAGPDDQPPGTRFNDGKVSPDGRFFAGTMDEKTLREPIAVALPPRPGREPARGRRRADRLQRPGLERRRRHDVPLRQQGPGRLDLRLRRRRPAPSANRRVLARPTEEIGRPDGAAATSRATTGVPGISAGVLNRWAPDGSLDRSIPLPVSQPDLPLLRRPRPHDDLRDVAAPRPARRRPRREARLGRDRRAAGRRRRGTRRPLRGLAADDDH